ncbi:ABC transporter substrate-binding protein [Lunatibacter salilacus]|uniref:ABC transporter substrate-binding protein n=1 Tax=Lunatibacter salilacus TaxID=2483804 RepID=UPI00131C7449|nr:ABC transporter substrate-binding protein [Lunatibacter salilacus]
MNVFLKSRLIFALSPCLLWTCTPSGNSHEAEIQWEEIDLMHARGFTLKKSGKNFLVEVLAPFPNAENSFRYLVLAEQDPSLDTTEFDAVIHLPLNRVVLTSTTQVPHLDLLGVSDYLSGFPNLDLISSESVRKRINAGEVSDLGSGPTSNLEKVVELDPDLIMLSTLGNDLDQLDLYRRAGIPAVINGDYVEETPLGRAEWIKFSGALMGELDEATVVFDSISSAFEAAGALIQNQELIKKPTVLSGVLYQDIWYAPGNKSWAAALLEAAGGQYIFHDLDGTGSLTLSYEYVLDQAQNADYWIGAADFANLSAMANADQRYLAFDAFRNQQVFTYTHRKGEKGGLLYFELGYVRPDLVLLDLIKILNPDLLPDYELYFYTQMDEK